MSNKKETFVELECRGTRTGNRRMSFCIVNTQHCGKRIRLSNELIEELGNPPSVCIKVSSTSIKIGSYLKNCEQQYKISRNNTLYNSALIVKLTEYFDLDFTERTSMTFTNIKVKHLKRGEEQIPYAYIRICEGGDFIE